MSLDDQQGRQHQEDHEGEQSSLLPRKLVQTMVEEQPGEQEREPE
jgi:hypothetical protein